MKGFGHNPHTATSGPQTSALPLVMNVCGLELKDNCKITEVRVQVVMYFKKQTMYAIC